MIWFFIQVMPWISIALNLGCAMYNLYWANRFRKLIREEYGDIKAGD